VQENLRWSYGFDTGSLDGNESKSEVDVSTVQTLFLSVGDFPKQADKIGAILSTGASYSEIANGH
jgi:hypothetical protein